MTTTEQETREPSDAPTVLRNAARRLRVGMSITRRTRTRRLWKQNEADLLALADALAALTPEVVAALKAATARPAIRLLPDESERIEQGLSALDALARQSPDGGEG